MFYYAPNMLVKKKKISESMSMHMCKCSIIYPNCLKGIPLVTTCSNLGLYKKNQCG